MKGLEQAALDLGGSTVPIDLTKAHPIEFEAISKPAEKVDYIVIVKSEGKEIHRIAARDSRESAPEAPASEDRSAIPGANAARSIKPNTGEKKSIPVQGLITDVIQERGGQFSALLLAADRKIALFDAAKQSIVKTIPLASSDVLVAGTQNLS